VILLRVVLCIYIYCCCSWSGLLIRMFCLGVIITTLHDSTPIQSIHRVFPSSYLHLRIRCKVFRAPQKNLIVFSSHNYQCCVYVLMWVLWMSCLPGSCFLFIISYICFHVGFDGSDLSSFVKFSEFINLRLLFSVCSPLNNRPVSLLHCAARFFFAVLMQLTC
jgi:hypothetical protein